MSMQSVAVRLLPIVVITFGAVWFSPVQAGQAAGLSAPARRIEAALAARTPAICPLRWPHIVLTCVA